MTFSISDVRLRPGAPADLGAIRALTRAAYQPWVAVIGREPLPMQTDYAAALAAHRFDLAFLGGDLVGLIETHEAPDHLLIVNVAVAPAWQGRGLGRRLMAEAEALARTAGLAELRLYTNGAFARNLRLYRDLGFAVDRRESGERGVTVHMLKRLDAPPRRLLFLPGAGADPAFWRKLGEQLPAAWAKRYFGWPGLGDQPPHPAVNGVADLVAMVEAELEPGPVDLLAQSMGGVVALQVALRHPEMVRRLVLTATSGGVDAADLTRFDWRANYRREYPRAAPVDHRGADRSHQRNPPDRQPRAAALGRQRPDQPRERGRTIGRAPAGLAAARGEGRRPRPRPDSTPPNLHHWSRRTCDDRLWS